MMASQEVKTLDSGSSWLYVLTWPLGEEEKKEAFVIPVFSRSQGVLLAVPVDFLPREVLEGGQSAG